MADDFILKVINSKLEWYELNTIYISVNGEGVKCSGMGKCVDP